MAFFIFKTLEDQPYANIVALHSQEIPGMGKFEGQRGGGKRDSVFTGHRISVEKDEKVVDGESGDGDATWCAHS